MTPGAVAAFYYVRLALWLAWRALQAQNGGARRPPLNASDDDFTRLFSPWRGQRVYQRSRGGSCTCHGARSGRKKRPLSQTAARKTRKLLPEFEMQDFVDDLS
jgi:hypothetical protein